MCCKFFSIPEVNKFPNEWCKHCRRGKGGCTIYAEPSQGLPKRFRMLVEEDVVDDAMVSSPEQDGLV